MIDLILTTVQLSLWHHWSVVGAGGHFSRLQPSECCRRKKGNGCLSPFTKPRTRLILEFLHMRGVLSITLPPCIGSNVTLLFHIMSEWSWRSLTSFRRAWVRRPCWCRPVAWSEWQTRPPLSSWPDSPPPAGGPSLCSSNLPVTVFIQTCGATVRELGYY